MLFKPGSNRRYRNSPPAVTLQLKSLLTIANDKIAACKRMSSIDSNKYMQLGTRALAIYLHNLVPTGEAGIRVYRRSQPMFKKFALLKRLDPIIG